MSEFASNLVAGRTLAANITLPAAQASYLVTIPGSHRLSNGIALRTGVDRPTLQF